MIPVNHYMIWKLACAPRKKHSCSMHACPLPGRLCHEAVGARSPTEKLNIILNFGLWMSHCHKDLLRELWPRWMCKDCRQTTSVEEVQALATAPLSAAICRWIFFIKRGGRQRGRRENSVSLVGQNDIWKCPFLLIVYSRRVVGLTMFECLLTSS